MSNISNGSGGFVGDMSGAQYWAYQNTHNSAMRRNQQARMSPTTFQPYHVPQLSRPSTTQAPTYAQVVRSPSPIQSNTRGHRVVQRNLGETSLNRQSMPPYQRINQQQSIGGSFSSSSSFQYQPQGIQSPSYAQVVARSSNKTSTTHQSLARTTNPMPFGYNQNMQQYGQQMVDQAQHNTTDGYTDQQSQFFEDLEPFVAQNNADTFDQFSNFATYQDPLSEWLMQPTPFVERAGLVVNTSPNPNIDPSQLLMSPAESMETSSVASSTRRSKREIMSGNSGPYKCSHCGGGFNTGDDQRHHMYRVHLPYSSRPFPCSKCEKRFIYNKDLVRHDRERHGDRQANARYWCPFQGCEYATKGFVRKDHYNRHYATHFKADSAVQMSRSTSAHTFSQQ